MVGDLNPEYFVNILNVDFIFHKNQQNILKKICFRKLIVKTELKNLFLLRINSI